MVRGQVILDIVMCSPVDAKGGEIKEVTTDTKSKPYPGRMHGSGKSTWGKYT